MTGIEAYKKFTLKLNENASAGNIDISVGEFILIYNEQQTKWFDDQFRNRSNRNVDKVQALIVPHYEIEDKVDSPRHSQFKMPDDYFDFISMYALAGRGECENVPLDTFEIKLANEDLYYNDPNNEPSVEYHETFIALAANKILVYRKDFDINKVFLTYYRYPKQMDIFGYVKLDGTLSSDVDPELDTASVNEIIDYCVLEVNRNNGDQSGVAISKDRTQ